jgi:hypothetical protein
VLRGGGVLDLGLAKDDVGVGAGGLEDVGGLDDEDDLLFFWCLGCGFFWFVEGGEGG